ncbi:MAG: hypothetical protein MZV70_50195 [Desulfobacterales bacterium]|nr:hypothetical protein [Desulfobacterales bacterium]
MLTAFENVELPLAPDRPLPARAPRARRRRPCGWSSLEDRMDHYPAPALRRPAAAGGHRPRHRHRPDDPRGRRAHGRPRPRLGRGGAGPDGAAEPRAGQDHHHGDPRPAGGPSGPHVMRHLDKGVLDRCSWKILFRNAFRHKLRTRADRPRRRRGRAGLRPAAARSSTPGTPASTPPPPTASSRATPSPSSSPCPSPTWTRSAQVDGVKAVSYGNWFGGIYIDAQELLRQLRRGAQELPGALPGVHALPEDQRTAFLQGPQGLRRRPRSSPSASAGRSGDTVTLKGTIYSGDWPMSCCGASTGAATRAPTRTSSSSTGTT